MPAPNIPMVEFVFGGGFAPGNFTFMVGRNDIGEGKLRFQSVRHIDIDTECTPELDVWAKKYGIDLPREFTIKLDSGAALEWSKHMDWHEEETLESKQARLHHFLLHGRLAHEYYLRNQARCELPEGYFDDDETDVR